ncbi:MAG: DUF2087 domain-containing protein [Chloroflexi bacterium]|nr:DUF2087 domain-containing protein [Chloroflexota bacterium]
MNAQNEMLNFLKAMSSADRLRIIGLLAQKTAKKDEIVTRLNLPLRQVVNHLAFLEHVGVIGQTDGVYELKTTDLQKLARKQLAVERPAYVPAPELDKKSSKILKAYLNADGSIKQLPFQPGRLRVILDYLVQAFEPDVDYAEKEVNTIIKRFHEDFSGLRRDLIEAGLLARESDGSRYWRNPKSVEGRPV